MKKKYLKHVSMILFSVCIACSAWFATSAQEVFAIAMENTQELSVSFQEEFPKTGEELHVKVTGLGENEFCSYTWKVGQTVVGQGEFYTPKASDLENFITVTVTTSDKRTAEYSAYFSKLPVVYIDTNNVPIVDKENYVPGYMNIQGNDKYNSENSTLYNGEMEMRGRGNSSWEAPKKPYRIKLESKADIFGMGSNKHWTLLANYFDPSLSRNELSYDFSGELGLAFMDSENVILIMNGSYQGVYQLCEQIRIDKTRIDITDWEKIAEDTAETIAETDASIDGGDLEDYLVENMSWITEGKFEFNKTTYDIEDYEISVPDITGGYVLELDKNMDEESCFYSSHNQPMMFKDPEFVKTNDEMFQYVKDYINAFEAAVDAEDGYTTYQGKEVHYSELYDMDDLVQYFLVTELFFNTDGMKKSTYMYKDHEELMKMGPIWDMDWCAGSPFEQASPADRWQTLFYDDEMVSEQWYRSLLKDPYFAYRVKSLYDECHDAIDSFTAKGGRIDQNIDYLKEAALKNDGKWHSGSEGFMQNTEKMKSWMERRVSWLDDQMPSVDGLLQSWGVYNSNQEHNEVISVEAVSAEEEGILIEIQTSGTNAVGVYINGIKYAEEQFENKQSEVLIPYEALKDQNMEDVFVVVRTENEGKICTAYKAAEVQLPDPDPDPDPDPNPETDVTKIFEDVMPGKWYVANVQYVSDKGLMSGNKGFFNPENNVTRAQVVTTLYRMAGSPKVTDYSACEKLTDVLQGQYYTDPICWAYNEGIATGNNGKFDVAGNLTRQQMAAFFFRYAEVMGYDVKASADYSHMLNADKVSDYAVNAVKWAVGSGLISGSEKTDPDGNKIYDLNPRGYTTRAQLAAILQRFCATE